MTTIHNAVKMARLGGLCAALLVSGCASFQPQNTNIGIKSGVIYDRDIGIKFEGIEAEGAVVLPERSSYDITLESKGDIDLLTFETCHRTMTPEKAYKKYGKKRWFSYDKRKITVPYIPVDGIEKGPIACPVRIGAYEKDKGRHSWAFIDFQSKDMKMPARLRCGGDDSNVTGVAVCEERAGSIQELTFPGRVLVSEHTGCEKLQTKDRITFRFNLPKGECVYRFKEESREGRDFRLTTIGTDGILIRERK